MSDPLATLESGINSAAMANVGPVTVLIAGNPAALRDELARLVRMERGLSVVGISSNASQAVEDLERFNPDILILDFEMDGATDVVRRKIATTDVILLTAPEDKTQIAKAIKLGCSGIARKQASAKLIVDSIRTVRLGNVWLDPEVLSAMAEFATTPQYRRRRSTDGSCLSEREQEVVQLVSQGYKNSGIAQQMSISEQTVKNHLHSIFNKVGVSDRLDLALYAVHRGWHLTGKTTGRSYSGSQPIFIRPFEAQH